MSEFLWRLGIASFLLAISGIISWLLLRCLQVRSPRVHAAVGWLVLIQGLLLVEIPVTVSWWPATVVESAEDQLTQNSIEPGVISHDDLFLNQFQHSGTEFDQPIVKSPAAERVSFREIAIVTWLSGAALLLVVWGSRYVCFIRDCGTECSVGEWNHEWHSLLQEAGITGMIPLFVTPDVGPVLCRHPSEYRLIVPSKLWSTLSPLERRCILRHELAHYERADVWKSLLSYLLLLPHWFNPVAWFAVRQIEIGAEWACDDAVRHDGQQSSTDYARALLALGTANNGRQLWMPAATDGGLAQRIRRVISINDSKESRMKTAVPILVLLTIAAGSTLRVKLAAQERATTAQPANSGDNSDLSTITVPEIVKGLLELEQSIQNLGAEFELQRTSYFRGPDGKAPSKGLIQDDPVKALSTIDAIWLMTSAGHPRCEAMTELTSIREDTTEVNRTRGWMSTFDGSEFRSIWTELDPTGKVLHRDAKVGDSNLSPTSSPFELTSCRFSDKPFSKVIAEAGTTILRQDRWEGRPVLVVETPPQKGPRDLVFKEQLWIDVRRNFLVVRARCYQKLGDTGSWGLHVQNDRFRHVEVAPGIWLPSYVEELNNHVREDGSTQPVVEEKITVTNWNVNQPIDDDQFALEFPADIPVHQLPSSR